MEPFLILHLRHVLSSCKPSPRTFWPFLTLLFTTQHLPKWAVSISRMEAVFYIFEYSKKRRNVCGMNPLVGRWMDGWMDGWIE